MMISMLVLGVLLVSFILGLILVFVVGNFLIRRAQRKDERAADRPEQ